MTERLDNVYIALGSNLGDRLANLRSAVAQLNRAGVAIVAASPVFETQPVGAQSLQDDYFNSVIQARVKHSPAELLDLCLSIESHMGRVRREPNEARIIDLDILLFADQVIRSDRLTVPHPRLHLRRFVLEPLARIAPDVVHPVLNQNVREILAALPPDGEAPPRRVTDAELISPW